MQKARKLSTLCSVAKSPTKGAPSWSQPVVPPSCCVRLSVAHTLCLSPGSIPYYPVMEVPASASWCVLQEFRSETHTHTAKCLVSLAWASKTRGSQRGPIWARVSGHFCLRYFGVAASLRRTISNVQTYGSLRYNFRWRNNAKTLELRFRPPC